MSAPGQISAEGRACLVRELRRIAGSYTTTAVMVSCRLAADEIERLDELRKAPAPVFNRSTHQLVPVVPTPAMIEAMKDLEAGLYSLRDGWTHILDAALAKEAV